MSHSEQINELSTALAKAQGAMKAATFNKVNPHFKSKYADLAAVWEAVRGPLSTNGLSVTQTMESNGDGNLWLHTLLHHSSGQWIGSDYPLPSGAKPQEFGSALTYARRYSLAAIVGIASDEDDDANAAQKSEGPRQVIRTSLPTSVHAASEIVEEVSERYTGEPYAMNLGDTPDWTWFGRQMIELSATGEWAKWRELNMLNMQRMKSEARKPYEFMSAQLKKARE